MAGIDKQDTKSDAIPVSSVARVSPKLLERMGKGCRMALCKDGYVGNGVERGREGSQQYKV
jgi:hypothetical protein